MEGKMGDTQKSQTITTKLHQIAKQARENPERVFISLAHLMDVDFLREAYRKTRKDGAPGVDGIRGKYSHYHSPESFIVFESCLTG